MVILVALFISGCSDAGNSVSKEGAISSLAGSSMWEQYVLVDDKGYDEKTENEINLSDSVSEGAECQESAETHLMHSSEWYPYMWVQDDSYGAGADHAFMNSGDQHIHMYWFYELSDILYDYGKRTDQDLLSDGWVVERITPIGRGGYYNARLHQKSGGKIANIFIDDKESEYKVLYIIDDFYLKYDNAKNESDYMSQYNWISFNREEISVTIDNPFEDIYEASTYTELAAAVTAYENAEGYTGNWKLQEIYAHARLTDYLLTSEDRMVWVCLDERAWKYAAETFYIENE